jgi:cytoskeletal protein CcmA (bactofilin family)
MILCTGLLFGALSASAVDFVQTDQFISAETNALTEETWLLSETATLNGVASNDLFAVVAQLSELNGTFHGDTWIVTDQLQGNGIFNDALRVVARSTIISGTVNGPLLAIGNSIQVGRTATVHNDAICIGETVVVNGLIQGDLHTFAQDVTLGGRFDGDVHITAQDIVILPDTIIHGDLTYTAPEELVLSSSVLFSGKLNRTFEPIPKKTFFVPNIGWHAILGLAALVAGLAFAGLFPGYTFRAQRALTQTRGLCLLIGFAGLVLLPMAAFFLLFTVVAMPLSILALLFLSILAYLAKIIVAMSLGAALLRRKTLTKRSAAAPLAIGLLLLYALSSIVVISWIINFLILIFGLGALLVALFKKPVLVIPMPETLPEPNKEN